MTPKQVEKLEKFLTESFGEGIYTRELRLSYEEMEYLKKLYPKASVEKSSLKESSDEKLWWEVNLLASNKDQIEVIDFEEEEVTAV